MSREELVAKIKEAIRQSQEDLSGTNDYHFGYEHALDFVLELLGEE